MSDYGNPAPIQRVRKERARKERLITIEIICATTAYIIGLGTIGDIAIHFIVKFW